MKSVYTKRINSKVVNVFLRGVCMSLETFFLWMPPLLHSGLHNRFLPSEFLPGPLCCRCCCCVFRRMQWKLFYDYYSVDMNIVRLGVLKNNFNDTHTHTTNSTDYGRRQKSRNGECLARLSAQTEAQSAQPMDGWNPAHRQIKTSSGGKIGDETKAVHVAASNVAVCCVLCVLAEEILVNRSSSNDWWCGVNIDKMPEQCANDGNIHRANRNSIQFYCQLTGAHNKKPTTDTFIRNFHICLFVRRGAFLHCTRVLGKLIYIRVCVCS